MPKVQEYLPEQEAQGPVGQTSPMLEQVSLYGRGLETFGREIGDAANVVRQRETQKETSDAYANVAEQRASYMQRIEEARNDGSLNDETMQQIKDDYQDWTEKQYDSYSTSGGKDAFVRASARAGGAILTTGARAQTVVAGAKAQENLLTLSNVNSNLVMQDPHQFDDLRDAQREAVHAQIESGALTPAQGQQTMKAMDLELAKSATRGFMQSDYAAIKAAVVANDGKIDPNKPEFNKASVWLNNEELSPLLNSDAKKSLDAEIRQNQVSAQVAGKQVIDQKRDALSAQGEAFKFQMYQKLENNSFTPDENTKAYNSGLISAQEWHANNHLIEQAGKQAIESNPALVNSLRQRILSPSNDPQHISDPNQIAMMVQSKMISIKDFTGLANEMKMIPENQVNAFNEAKLLSDAKRQIGTGPDAEYRLMMFSNEVQKAKQAAISAKQPLSAVFDSKSKDYIGNSLPKYLVSPQEALAAQAAKIRGDAQAPAPIDAKLGVVPNTAVNAGPKAADISGMDLEGLKKLNPKNLNPEQKAAAAARWRALKGAQ